MELKSINEFLKYSYDKDPTNSNLLYRGQTNNEWKLKPSVHRGNLLRYQTMILESFMIYTFKDRNFDSSHIYTKQEIEFLAMCQHYGIPTRLLDVSTDILVSIFFACNNNTDKDGALFIINKNDFTKFSSKSFRETTSEPLLIDSNFINPRLRVQSGSFILWGIDCLDSNLSSETYDLEEYLQYNSKNTTLEKIIIKSEYKKDLLKELEEIYGICEETILIKNRFSEKIENYYSRMKKIADILTYEITADSSMPSLLNLHLMNFHGCINLKGFPEDPMEGFSDFVKVMMKILR